LTKPSLAEAIVLRILIKSIDIQSVEDVGKEQMHRVLVYFGQNLQK
jgi:hypothetical protein